MTMTLPSPGLTRPGRPVADDVETRLIAAVETATIAVAAGGLLPRRLDQVIA